MKCRLMMTSVWFLHGGVMTIQRGQGHQEWYRMGRVKRIWYLSPMRAAKVQASLRIRAVSPEPPLLAHTSSESRGTFRQKARSLAPLNDWACAVKICHDGMFEDTNSLDAARMLNWNPCSGSIQYRNTECPWNKACKGNRRMRLDDSEIIYYFANRSWHGRQF